MEQFLKNLAVYMKWYRIRNISLWQCLQIVPTPVLFRIDVKAFEPLFHRSIRPISTCHCTYIETFKIMQHIQYTYGPYAPLEQFLKNLDVYMKWYRIWNISLWQCLKIVPTPVLFRIDVKAFEPLFQRSIRPISTCHCIYMETYSKKCIT